ncbi:MAG TPA: hypothetical protein VFJ94_01700 [Intrasporangium sp.]|uniref:hypothetical protein n=1 Tax=Intrasporangium sp. TaxID=1925024 RepID=UPI002D77FFCC|nr:hypothetical protein [Intrasporangium sp.]HET7397208.1 hypothetical protein [Intrasporangium sp.]
MRPQANRSVSESTPPPAPKRDVPSRRRALGLAVAALASVGLGGWAYAANAPALDMLAVELGGRSQYWPLPPGTEGAVAWDYVFIAGYGLALWLGTGSAGWVFWSPRAAQLARLGRVAAVVAVVADLIENLLLTAALRGVGDRGRVLDAVAAAATVKFSTVLPAAVVALLGVVVTLFRLWVARFGPYGDRHATHGWLADDIRVPEAVEIPPPEPSGRPTSPPTDSSAAPRPAEAAPHTEGTDESRWRRAYTVPGITGLAERTAATESVGVCLSGGGIRSASVAFGALQSLRAELRGADYLVSVSGGGYAAGAFAQLLTDAGDGQRLLDGATPVHDADAAYQAGSVEFDHVRRHSSYLADTAGRMLVALGVLARGLLSGIVLLFAPAVVLGLAAAWFYRSIPVATLPLLPRATPRANSAGVTTTVTPDLPFTMPPHAVAAVAVIGGVALGVWLVQLLAYSRLSVRAQRVYAWASRVSVVMTHIVGMVVLITVGIPVIVWLAARTISLVGASVQVGVSGWVGAVSLTYVASIASMLWRRLKTVRNAGLGKAAPATRIAVPRALVQLLLVIASLAVLVASWLLVFGVATVVTATDLAAGNVTTSLVQGAVLLAAVVVLGGFVDESSLSLHPFYRRRLATAFATRTLRAPTATGPATVAMPYHQRERTLLSSYATVADAARPFPEFVFAAAANLTGQHLTPSGLPAVSFTLGASWVGGPDIGWVRTTALESVAPPRLQRDLTVQAAVAISGAAVAAAMGRFSRWYQVLLAISGARLGAWLPNPLFLSAMREARDAQGRVLDWTMPGLPAIRRATYLLREVFNVHPVQERLLHVTDGGHYENLGIVELLRRRCTTIYCVDGGGDSPPTAPGLAEAIALAECELGVSITLHHPFHAEPGAGNPLVPQAPLTAVNSALAKEPVILGTFTYPAASGLPEGARTGTLLVGRALLWPEMPYGLLSYAAQHREFPHDSTGDQWFDDGQFTAYTRLGRALGVEMRRARQESREVSTPRRPRRPVLDGHAGPRGRPLPMRLTSPQPVSRAR